MTYCGFGFAAAATVAIASAAQGAGILSFSFSDLNGSFTPGGGGTGNYSAVGANTGGLQTAGDVTRLTAPGGTALFGPGLDPADISLTLSLTNINSSTADATGSFTIVDNDGDQLTGTVSGVFEEMFGNGGTFFNGTVSNVQFVAGGGGPDSTFDGTAGGSFNSDLGPPGIFNGFVVNLFINPTNDFFVTGFSGASSQFSGIIIPAPASMALGLIGVATLYRRKR